jgi:hypothetical protein
MSEERTWAEDTVALGAGNRRAPLEPTAAPPPRPRRPRWLKAAPLMASAGAAVVVLALIGGGGDSPARPEAIKPEPERNLPIERTRTPSRPTLERPVRRRAGSLAVGLARRAPKPAKPEPSPTPAPVEPEPPPAYEPAPEPVAEPAPVPEPSPAPEPETPAVVEFGM